ncbi:unnamed protein product [Heligmosomoides polygyrus]|uniref:Uncharacterized protein n=1 Tax=Heligmosomoides polygyrus TaxID=6339 RepID=A0A183G4N0_HELPZ|nr:unnamed protein product [Heligmosomoides polygyrus]
MEGQDLDRFRGLDMSHGFIKSIVKNQIDRDEYHKVMEERKIEVQRKIRESRRRKTLPPVEYKLYVPPHLRGKPAEDAQTKEAADRRNPCPAIVSEIEESTLRERVRNRVQSRHEDVLNLCPVGGESMQSSTPSRPIFLLNLKKNSGDFVDVAVMSTDNAARLAKELGRKHGLTDDQCRMLRLTLERELEARLAS